MHHNVSSDSTYLLIFDIYSAAALLDPTVFFSSMIQSNMMDFVSICEARSCYIEVQSGQ
jgi:hypothetical protein